ncbi:MAG: HD domain-containing protein [Sphingomonas sp.]|uniref:HD domain-containing protein n=1 Tax=Sphingomonas sp. TaxID=28214 RepID=UPI0017C2DE45|nr:HD domain-containing protein [Sphingomonas sp.]MBA3666689.1 HD domain-containing protein [Sphingomonas sp.]
MNEPTARATFRSMEESTAEDWQVIGANFFSYGNGLADRVLTHLKLLDGDYGGFPVDRLQHSLQTATRAHRGGESEEYVVTALLHDIGDTLGSYNHPDIAAAILKPFVNDKLHWITEHHGIFQGYYFFHYLGMNRDMREAFRGHEHYEDTARFCELYDQNAFDGSYDSAPLEFFEPMVRRVFARPVNSVYKAVAESG